MIEEMLYLFSICITKLTKFEVLGAAGQVVDVGSVRYESDKANDCLLGLRVPR